MGVVCRLYILPVLVPVTTPVPSPSLLVNNPNDRGGPIAPYYSGQEIGCYMPHRGDFAVVGCYC